MFRHLDDDDRDDSKSQVEAGEYKRIREQISEGNAKLDMPKPIRLVEKNPVDRQIW